MLKLRSFFWGWLFLVVTFLAGCGREEKEVELTAAFPEDIDFAFVVDYSDEEQRKNFREILEKFSMIDLGVLNTITFQARNLLEREGYSYDEDIEPIFEEPWKIGIAINFPVQDENEDSSLRGFVNKIELYVVLQLEEADDFEDLIERIIENQKYAKFDYREDGDFKYWTKAKDGTFMRYEDLFVSTMTLEDAQSAAERLKNGGGLNENKVFKEKREITDNLGYIYVNFEEFKDFYGKVYEETGLFAMAELIGALKSVYFSMIAEEDGLMFDTSVGFDASAAGFEKLFPDPDYRLSLVDKVNGEGLIFYTEQPSFENIFRPLVEFYQAGYSEELVKSDRDGLILREDDPGLVKERIIREDSVEANKSGFISVGDDPRLIVEAIARGDSKKTYEEIIADFSKKFALNKKKLSKLIDSPFALSVSVPDESKIIPAIAMYFKLEKNEAAIAKKLLAIVDRDMDELLGIFDGLMRDEGGKAGVIKKDLKIANGGGLRELSVNWDAFSRSFGMVGLDLNQVDTALYYGLTGDNVLVLALFPDFPKHYGKNVVSENKDFEKAIGRLAVGDLVNVDYFSVKEAMSFYEKLIEVGVLGDEFKSVLEIFGYLVAGSEFKEDVLWGSVYMEVRK